MSEYEKITAYVTKYALTEGIKTVQGEVCHGISSAMLSISPLQNVHGKDWHRTPNEALARANEMRISKIASLKCTISRLEALTFKVEE